MANITSPIYKTYNGYSYKPGNPAFHAYTSSTSISFSSTINFDSEYFNIGNNFFGGTFQAPISGIYFFFWGCIGNTTAGTYRIRILKNGSRYGWNNTTGNAELRLQAPSGFDTNYSRIFIHELDRFDQVSLQLQSSPSNVGLYGGEWTYFGGYLFQ